MEDPHLPADSMRMPKLLMADTIRHKAMIMIIKLDVIGAFLQAI
jgi:hypothetical protein